MDIPFYAFSPEQAWPRQDQDKTFMDNAIATFQQLAFGLVGNLAVEKGLIETGQGFQVDKMEEHTLTSGEEAVGIVHVYGTEDTPIVSVAYMQDNIIIKIVDEPCRISLIN